MALIPPGYMTAVVSLGTLVESFRHVGTGFLYAHPLPARLGRTPYRAYLVTNKHVVDENITHVRFNDPEGGLTATPFETVGTGAWTFHPNGADLAVMALLQSSPLSKGQDLLEAQMFIGDVGTTFGEGVQPVEGDGTFVIGFPLGLVGDARNYPSSDLVSSQESRTGYGDTKIRFLSMLPPAAVTAGARSSSNRKPPPSRQRSQSRTASSWE